MIKSELFMGRKITTLSDGLKSVQRVSDKEIGKFLSDVVAPRFPGFTVLQGIGYWKGKSEGCIVLVILHEDRNHEDYPNTLHRIKRIINEYKKRFHQESVLWLQSEVEVK